jgi:hypothetical protein
VLLSLIKAVGILLPELIGVDGITVGLLLASSKAKVIWPLLKVVKKKSYRRFTRADLL